jgi:hypothetical protein
MGIDAAAFGVIGGFLGAIVGAVWTLKPAAPFVTAILPSASVDASHRALWSIGTHLKL